VVNVRASDESDGSESSRADASTRADGGVSESGDLFTQTSSVPERSRRERFLDGINAYVLAPTKIILEDPRGLVGFGILTFTVLLGTIGVVVIPEPTTMEAPIWARPFQDLAYPLGTGVLGQQVGRQVVHATPDMLKMILAGALLSMVLGTVIGTLAGYKSGWWDYVMMMFSDTVMTIPALALVVVLAAVWTPSNPYVVGLILGINNWPGLARTIRSEVLSMREEDVIESARVMGLSNTRILRKYIVRSLMPYISINFANSSRRIIFEAVGLYYLGVLGTSGSNWGVMMEDAYNNADLTNIAQLHWLVFPMLMIVLLTLGLILTAQSLDRLWNVRLRARHVQDDEDEGNELPVGGAGSPTEGGEG
jgi:peptide/nickel transport system permease protein